MARLHQASLLAPFFQWHLATLRLCVTFSQFLQYFKLLNHYYICYSDMWCALLKNLLIYLFLTVLGLRCCVGFSLVAASQGYSSLQCMGFSRQWLLLLQSTGSRHLGFSSCGMWLSGCSSWAVEHRFSSWVLGLDCSVACGIFPDQYWIHASCIGKWILYHWIIREAQ